MAHVLIVGSGFGGSIAAKRFTEAGHTASILELGEDFRPAGKMEQSQDTKFILRVFRDYPKDYLLEKPKVVITQGMGLGGGSLVYSGIHLRAPTTAFTGWPSGWTRTNLNHYYARVEDRLGVAPLPNAASFPRSQRLAEAASIAGLPAPQANPLAMTNCTACGWCVPICKWGKKNTMQHTYLQDAINTGRLSIWTNRKVRYIAKYGSKYRVVYWKTDSAVDNYQAVNSGSEYYQEGDYVVVACGAIESPALLERSMSVSLGSGYTRLASFSQTYVGNGISGTGDFIQGGFLPSSKTVNGFKGAIMMNNIDMGDYVLEDITAIPVGPSVKLEVSFPDVTVNGKRKNWGLAYKQKFRNYGKHMFAVGIMGKQASGTEGNITVSDDNGNAKVSNTAYQPPTGSIAAARSLVTALGGTVADTPWENNGVAATVHPTGGVRMGTSTSYAVQPTNLQLRNNANMYVIDGSVLPGSPFRNPAHTIAAVAERALDVILGVHSSTYWPPE